jgi:hypothetical protein
MKKLIFQLILIALFPTCWYFAMAQKVPDCDTTKISWAKTGSLDLSTGSPMIGVAPYKLFTYHWVTFSGENRPTWSVDNPEKTKDKYIIHIKRKQLKWLNDSTAVYAYPKTK